ncbi:hypothetical protein V6N13_014283 [Hibiscus sabdariffa]
MMLAVNRERRPQFRDVKPDIVLVNGVVTYHFCRVVLDGYSAPLTTGNFAKLVTDGAYDGTKLSCINQAIISKNDTGKNVYSVPSEIIQ